MLYFLGNCQADFVSRAMKERGYDCTYRVLASPLTYPSHPGTVPEALRRLGDEFDLDRYYHDRLPTNQFLPIPEDETPELIVLSLFHENVPLFHHEADDYTFFLDPRALNDHPEVMAWAQDNCRMFKPNPNKYLERYRDMLVRFSMDHPDTPIIVLARLSHFPAFGPEPFSYLEGWDTLWPTAQASLDAWAAALPNVTILDMNRVFGGIWSQSENGIESHCPFLKIKLEEQDGQVTSLHARRDIEHIGPMPGRLADKIAHFLKHGSIEYGRSEVVHADWNKPWRINKLDDEAILSRLTSGANYQCAEAIASFFLELDRDHTELLVQARDAMPVCHMTLHMIKAYGRIHRNPALALWCKSHREAARRFTANGPLYQEAYLERLDEIRAHALG